jgi:hypothetical protein
VKAFSKPVLALLDAARMLGIRAGADHRFTGIWFVVVGGRVFVNSWNDAASGWREGFRSDPRGAISVGAREIAVRTRPMRGEKLRTAIEAAYAAKYATKASRKWVRGFRAPKRRKTIVELLPR